MQVDTLKGLIAWLKEHIPTGFYGEVILSFENGKIVHKKKTESFK